MRSSPFSARPVARAPHGQGVVTPERRQWLRGKVAVYHPETYTYSVNVEDGAPIPDVVQLLDTPGDVKPLPPETPVVIHNEAGLWVIAGVLPPGIARRNEPDRVDVSEVRGVGGEDPVRAGDLNGDGRPENAPIDVQAGDRLHFTPAGNFVGALDGGTNVMKSSAMAQVRTHQVNDMVEIISSQFRHVTDMGESQVVNDEGHLSYTWRVGANEEYDTGGGKENYTVHFEVGAEGDLVHFEVTTPEGRTLSMMHASADGRLELYASGGIDITSGEGGTFSDVTAGDRDALIEGTLTSVVKKSADYIYRATRTTRVSGNDSLVVGGDALTSISGSARGLVSRFLEQTVMGGMLPQPGAAAARIDYVNGGVQTVLGNPVKGALPLKQTASWLNFAGGFHFACTPTALPFPAGGFAVLSQLPASVHLGCDGTVVPLPGGGYTVAPVPAPFGVVMYEPLALLLTTLATLIDTHIHTLVSPAGPTAPPTVPLSPTVASSLASLRSLRVSVGG